MADPILAKKAREALERYHQTHTPEEVFADLVAAKIINEKGEVLMTEAGKKAGRPLDDEPSLGRPTR